jgi:WD40 repeat protein
LPGGKETGSVKAHAETIESVSVTPDGKEIVTGSDDQTAKVFDASGKETATLKGHAGKIYAVALSPDGKRAATASEDGSLKIWDVASSKDTATIKSDLPEPKAEPKTEPKADPKAKEPKKGKAAPAPAAAKSGPPFRCVAFSPDGKTLAAGAEDGEIRLIDAESGNVSKTIKAHEGVFSVTWNAKGDKLATGGWDKTIRIWDLTGKELNVIKAHGSDQTLGTVTALAFSPNGEFIASGGLDGLVKVWPVAKK